MIRHHPNEETLGLHAFGGLKAGARLVVSAHIAACRECRDAVAALEAVAGVVLETAETAPLAPDALARALEQLDAPVAPARTPIDVQALMDKGWWLPAAPGLWFKPLSRRVDTGEKLYLLKAKAGVPLPEHGHNGYERLVVLKGTFGDHDGLYGPGDFAECDESTVHEPFAKTDCVCLAATEGPLRFSGVARWVQPFLGV